MFYSDQLLGKTSALGKLWIAAHAEGRLRKNDINETSVAKMVDAVLEHYRQAPLALRLSGMLMFGLVRIYKKQIEFLRFDCKAAVDSMNKAEMHSNAAKAVNNAKAASAANEDITIRNADETAELFRLTHMSDEEGFGLFENHSSSLALQMEAHESLDIDISGLLGTQIDDGMQDGEIAVPTDDDGTPEALRRASVSGDEGDVMGLGGPTSLLAAEFDADGGILGPALMEPNSTRRRRSLSREPSAALDSPRAVQAAAAAEHSPATVVNASPVGLPEMDLPDMSPAQPEVDMAEAPEVTAVDEGALPEADLDNEVAAPGAYVAMLPARASAAEQVPAGPPGEDAVAGSPASLDADQNPVSVAVARARKPRGAVRGKQSGGAPQRQRLHADPDEKSTRIPQAEVRALIHDRSSITRRVAPLAAHFVSGAGTAAFDAADDLATLMRPWPLQGGVAPLEPSLRAYLDATSLGRPASIDAFLGVSSVTSGPIGESPGGVKRRREQEVAAQSTGKRGNGAEGAGASAPPSPAEPERLRDAVVRSPSATGRDGSPTQHLDAALGGTASGAVPRMPFDDGPSGPPRFEPEGSLPLPDMDDLPEVAPPSPPDDNAGFGTFPGPGVASRPLSEALTMDPSGSSQALPDGTSLSAHTLATLANLREAAEASTTDRKRKSPGGGAGAAMVHLDSLIPAGSSRLEAARTFYDALVLQARGLASIQPQDEHFAPLVMCLPEAGDA